jgi:hypothetical protein
MWDPQIAYGGTGTFTPSNLALDIIALNRKEQIERANSGLIGPEQNHPLAKTTLKSIGDNADLTHGSFTSNDKVLGLRLGSANSISEMLSIRVGTFR